MEAIGGVGSVLATAAVDFLRRKKVSMVWPGRLQ